MCGHQNPARALLVDLLEYQDFLAFPLESLESQWYLCGRYIILIVLGSIPDGAGTMVQWSCVCFYLSRRVYNKLLLDL